MSYSNDNESYDDELQELNLGSVSIVWMPDGYQADHPVSQSFDPPEYMRETAEDLDWISVGLDVVELGLLLAPQGGWEDVVGTLDIMATAAGCGYSSRCYYGKPHENLPNMVVFADQAMAVNAVDWVLAPSSKYGGAVVACQRQLDLPMATIRSTHG